MAFRWLVFTTTAVAAAGAAALIGAGWLGGYAQAQPTNTIAPPPPAPRVFSGGCGVVAYPGTGARGTVAVTTGPVSCTQAMDVVDRYLHDKTLPRSGNTWAAEFDGWLCDTPTAADAEDYGYLSSCRHPSGSEVRVTAHRSTPAEVPPAPPCEMSAIADDVGTLRSVERCYGNWAYVSTGEFGDAQSLVRLVDGRWVKYTAFPSAICWAQAAADGVPVPEWHNFRC
ncbi:hypothetical protein [Mycolicibacterium vaccae]|uniref:hypothetical protein n=1 Tax=Mycolicibacterium vaccae TaxID=1810 RepID=UPI003CFD8144